MAYALNAPHAQSRPGAMQPLAAAQADSLIAAAADQLPLGFAGGPVAVTGRPLPYLEGGALIALRDLAARPPVTRQALWFDGVLTLLDGSADSVLAFNRRTGLALDARNAVDYLRCFFELVRDPATPFQVIEGPEVIPFAGMPDDRTLADLAVLIRPLALTGAGAGFAFTASGCFLFRNALIGAEVGLDRDGRVRLYGETVLMTAIPFCADA